MLADVDDPELCRIGTLAAFEALAGVVRRNAASPAPVRSESLTGVAIHLGVERTAAEVAMLFESSGHSSIGAAARELGCHQRTLERRLKELGLTVEALRRAARLIRARRRLSPLDSLTRIAVEEGFSGLAHMTRVFQTSCGMPPSLMRKIAWAEAARALAQVAAA